MTRARDLSKILTDSGLSSSAVSFIQSGGGAVTTTAQSKLREIVSVKDFGAVGNAVADDTAAIQAALNYVASRPIGGVVYIPAGYYKVSSTLTIPAARISIVGEPGSVSQLVRYTDYGDTIYVPPAYAVGLFNIEFQQQGPMTFGAHYHAVSGTYHWIQRCMFLDGYDTMVFEGTANIYLCEVSIYLYDQYQPTPPTGRIGLHIKARPDGTWGGDNFVDRCNFWMGDIQIVPGGGYVITTRGDYGIKADKVDGLWVSNTHIASTRIANYSFGSVDVDGFVGNTYMTNCMSDHNKAHGILFQGNIPIASFRYEGRISSLSLGDEGGNGIKIEAPCTDVKFDCSIDGFKSNGVLINHPGAENISFTSPKIRSIDTDGGGGAAFSIQQGSNINIAGGILFGDSTGDWGIDIGSGASGVVVTGMGIRDHTAGGIRVQTGASNITVTGCDVRNNTNVGGVAVEVQSGSSNVLISNCPGFSPISGSSSWTPGLIASGSSVSTTVTVQEAAIGDYVTVSAGASLSGLSLTGYVSAANTVTLILANPTTLGIIGPSTTYRARVEKLT